MSALDERRTLPSKAEDLNADLGFGSVVTRELRQRFLNRDGTFNVRREGLGFWESLSAYHYLLSIGWPTFLGYVTAGYIVLNAVFAAAYLACGPRALAGFLGATMEQRFYTAFFFSVHTLATIGYGNIVPLSMAANVIVTVESLAGLLGFGVVAGIAFARFARPTASILFSDNAIIAPYGDKTALMFRIVNQKNNQIVNLETTVILSRRKPGGTSREFVPLALERNGVTFFPLALTVVHPIDEKSPFYGEAENTFRRCEAEILIMLNGFDETFSQTVHTRSSYKGDEIIWGAKFRSMFNPPGEDGVISVDIRLLSEYERVALT
jgi:inward rectifier potassium channel